MTVRLAIVFLSVILSVSATRSQWVQAATPSGAYAPALTASGADLFAGTGNGVYCSTDGGAGWTPVSDGLGSRSITSLAAPDSLLLAGTYESGVFRSTDRGAHWAAANSGLTNRHVTALALKETTLFAGTWNGVYSSFDYGGSWTKADSGLPEQKAVVTSFAVKDSLLFVAIRGYGVYRSKDNGTTWSYSSNGLPPFPRVSCMAVAGRRIIAGTDTSGIFLSTDNGATWDEAGTGPGNASILSLAAGPGRGGVGGSHPLKVLAGTYSGLYLSRDSGNTWSAVNGGFPLSAPVLSALITDSSLVAGASFHGIFVSRDEGAYWVAGNRGLANSYIECLGASRSYLFAGAISLGLFRSSDHGARWEAINNGLPSDVEVLSFTSNETHLLLGTGNGVYHSSDNGSSWTPQNKGLPPNSRIEALTFLGDQLFAGTLDSGVYRSTDNGVRWVAAGNGLTFKGILCLAVSGTVLFAGGENGVHLSTDGGSSWIHAGLGLTVVQALAANGAGLFAALTGGGLYYSPDYGRSWSSSGVGIPAGASVGSFAVNGYQLFAATSAGIYLSTNSGSSWVSVDSGLVNKDTPVLLVSGAQIIAGTYGSGIWRRLLAQFVTSVEEVREQAGLFALEQNYPNPFNPITTIKYTVGGTPPKADASPAQRDGGRGAGEAGARGWEPVLSGVEGLGSRKTRLVVYDVLGRQVATLVDEAKAPGSYEVRFDGHGLASGVYIYRLMAGPHVQSRKMLLLR